MEDENKYPDDIHGELIGKTVTKDYDKDGNVIKETVILRYKCSRGDFEPYVYTYPITWPIYSNPRISL